MQSETAKTRLVVLALINLSFMVLGSSAAAQQSIEDNVRPAGQVCLAGQSCVGSTSGSAPVTSTRAAAPVAAAPAPVAAAPAPVAAPAPAPAPVAAPAPAPAPVAAAPVPVAAPVFSAPAAKTVYDFKMAQLHSEYSSAYGSTGLV